METTRNLSTPPDPKPALPRGSGLRGSLPVLVLGVAACLAALALHAYPMCRPWLFDDDFLYLAQSWTWQATRENLWLPMNEHAMPLGRLSTWVLVQLAGGRPTAMPLAAALQ